MDMDELKTLLAEIITDVKARIGDLASLEKLRQLESQIVGKKGRLGEQLFLRNRDIDALSLWNQGTEKELIAKASAHWNKVSG